MVAQLQPIDELIAQLDVPSIRPLRMQTHAVPEKTTFCGLNVGFHVRFTFEAAKELTNCGPVWVVRPSSVRFVSGLETSWFGICQEMWDCN